MTGFPIKTTNFTIKTTDFPIKTTDFHIKTTDFPIKTTDFPIKTTDFPIKTTDVMLAFDTKTGIPSSTVNLGVPTKVMFYNKYDGFMLTKMMIF